MGTKSREAIYGASVRAAAERAPEARKKADKLACDWSQAIAELNFKSASRTADVLKHFSPTGFNADG